MMIYLLAINFCYLSKISAIIPIIFFILMGQFLKSANLLILPGTHEETLASPWRSKMPWNIINLASMVMQFIIMFVNIHFSLFTVSVYLLLLLYFNSYWMVIKKKQYLSWKKVKEK